MKIFSKKPSESQRSRSNRVQDSRASSVFSYHSKRTREDSPIGREKLSEDGTNASFMWRQQVRLLPSWLAAVAILISAGYTLTLSTEPKIIVADGQPIELLQEHAVYREAAQYYLQGSLLNRSKLTIDTSALSRYMERDFPEISAASVTLPFAARRPIIRVFPSRYALLLTTTEGQFVIDIRGRVVLAARDANKQAVQGLPTVIDQSGLETDIGSNIMPATTVDFILELTNQTRAKGVKAKSLSLPALANELHARFDGRAYLVKFNTASEPRQSAGSLIATLQNLDKKGIVPSEYIDLRIPERAYYR